MTDPQLPSTPPEFPAPSGSPATPGGQSLPTPPSYPTAPASPAPPAYPAPAAYPAPPAQTAPAAPAGYPAAPPGAYQVPVGGYAVPAGAYAVPDTAARPSGLLGMLSLIFALIAAIVTPIVAGINAFAIGRVVPPGVTNYNNDLSIFSPVRDQVLWAELSFWAGTIFGIAAIVIGIIAIRKKQGRGAGIAALVVAVLGSVIFFVVLVIALGAGSATGLAGYAA